VGKIIFWIVVFFLVLLGLRLVSVHQTRKDAKDRRDEEERNRAGKRDDTPAREAMVKCGRCGVFFPKSTAVMTPQGLACNDPACAHRR
jgi:flagellar biosynthesis/type III secretory pathway M-ring protein FliF/YscJ